MRSIFVSMILIYSAVKCTSITPRIEKTAPGFFQIAIAYNRTKFVLHLHRNDAIFASNARNRAHCFYVGHVNDNHVVNAAFDLCGGISGTFGFESIGYDVIPRNRTINATGVDKRYIESPHAIESIRNEIEAPLLLLADSLIHLRKRRHISNVDNSPMYLELYLVNDHSIYRYYNRDVEHVKRRCQHIVNNLDSKFSSLGMRIILVGVEIWTKGDRIDISDSSYNTLKSFMNYREKHITTRNDNAQLITKQLFDGGSTAGKAAIGTVCSAKYSAGICHDSHSNPRYIINVVAHELGHNLGMRHDNREGCICDDTTTGCIMGMHLDAHVKSFSQCSENHFKNHLNKGYATCLHDFPANREKPGVRGNGVVEAGETCDCSMRDKLCRQCCDMRTCQLKDNASCARGGCCEKCQFKQKTTVCRPRSGECDLAEFCSGTSGECPSDVYVESTHPCRRNKGWCNKGVCMSHHHQCSHMIEGAKAGDAHCYGVLNSRGNTRGHCGKATDRSFHQCPASDVLCGKLQCSSTSFIKHHFQTTKLLWGNSKQQRNCVSQKSGENTGMVMDGTKCGNASVCHSHQCVAMATYRQRLSIKVCRQNCSGHGVCNNRGHCHCHMGWAPPHCDRPGNGGSVDSGPASLIHMSELHKIHKRPEFVLATLGAVFGFLCLLVLLTKLKDKMIEKCQDWQERRHRKLKNKELRKLLEE